MRYVRGLHRNVWKMFFVCVLGHSQPVPGGGGGGGGGGVGGWGGGASLLVSGTETILSQGSRGSPTFSRGEGGPNANFYRPSNL